MNNQLCQQVVKIISRTMSSGDTNVQKRNDSFPCSRRKDPCILIRKTVSILEHPITKHDYQRHVELIRDFLESTKHGYFMRDLSYIIRLLEILAKNVDGVEMYRTPLKLLLSLCYVPPLMVKSSDILEYKEDLEEYFSLLGYLIICLHDDEHQELVISSIINIFTRKSPAYICCVSLRNCFEAAENSRLPEIVSQLLEVVNDNIYQELLKIIILLAENSSKSCQIILVQNAINYLLMRIEPTWRNRFPYTTPEEPDALNKLNHFDDTIRILWLLLQHSAKNPGLAKDVVTPNVFSLWNFRYALRLLIRKKTKFIDRNNLAAILLKFLEFFPKMDFVMSFLADDIAVLAVSPEIITDATIASEYILTASDEDFEMKKILLLCLPYYIKYPGGIKVMERRKTIYALLLILKKQSPVWTVQQHCKLVVIALHILYDIIPEILEDFIENSGPFLMIDVMYTYLKIGYDIGILKASLETINHFVSLSIDSIISSLLYNHGIRVFLQLCNNLLTAEVLTSMHQRCLALLFCILTRLMKDSQTLMQTSVLCIKYLQRVLNPNPKDPIHDPRVLICGIDFVWQSLNDSGTLTDFVKNGGVYLMLDILQSCTFPVKVVTLGALVDLCDEGSCIPHLITWRKNGLNLKALLMAIFREENNRIGVKSTKDGLIADTELPLMGKQQWFETFCRCPHRAFLQANPTISDLFGSCRPKIYAMLQLLYKHEETVEIANDCYKLQNEELQPIDKVTMLLAENFLALKLGEAWIEVKTELINCGLKTLAIDGKIIVYLMQRANFWALHLQSTQEEIMKEEYDKEVTEEYKLYRKIQDSRLQMALEALEELKYIARCSEKMFRVSQKLHQQQEIDKKLDFIYFNATPHRTYMNKLQVTPVFNQRITVQSNTVTPHNPLDEPDLVSTGSNEHVDLEVPEDLLPSPHELNKHRCQL